MRGARLGRPLPPQGNGTHHDHFRLRAPGAKLASAPGASTNEPLAALRGRVLAEGETYER